MSKLALLVAQNGLASRVSVAKIVSKHFIMLATATKTCFDLLQPSCWRPGISHCPNFFCSCRCFPTDPRRWNRMRLVIWFHLSWRVCFPTGRAHRVRGSKLEVHWFSGRYGFAATDGNCDGICVFEKCSYSRALVSAPKTHSNASSHHLHPRALSLLSARSFFCLLSGMIHQARKHYVALLCSLW